MVLVVTMYGKKEREEREHIRTGDVSGHMSAPAVESAVLGSGF